MRWLVVAPLCFLAGCSRYADFTLPVLPGKGQQVVYEWNVHPAPVLLRDTDWDRIDALNPSVIKTREFLNYYSGFDGKSWHTLSAVSEDGIHWQKRAKLLSPDPATWEGDYIAANGTAIEEHGRTLYWYQGGRVPQIGLATNFVKHGSPFLEPVREEAGMNGVLRIPMSSVKSISTTCIF